MIKVKEYNVMKWLMVLFGCVFLLFGGCQELSRNKSRAEVTIEEGSEFPRFLAGAWKADKQGWQIVFEPNGVISSAVVPLGGVEVRPNRKTGFPGPKGEPGFLEAGDFDVYYNQQGRELAVDIKIKQFCRYLVNSSILKGSWEYLIVGDVSGDGKTWAGDVFNSLDIATLTPDPNSIEESKPKFEETSKLRINLGEEEEEHLIFTKVPDVNAGSDK
jgi:hypothetical protein